MKRACLKNAATILSLLATGLLPASSRVQAADISNTAQDTTPQGSLFVNLPQPNTLMDQNRYAFNANACMTMDIASQSMLLFSSLASGKSIDPNSFNPNGSCGSPKVPTDFSCEKNGEDWQIEKIRKRAHEAEAALICQKAKLTAAQGQLTCLRGQAMALQNTIASLGTAYQQNIGMWQQYIGQIKSTIKDREFQAEQVAVLLNGNKDSGKKGLLTLKDDVEKMVNLQMPDEILAMEAQFKQVEEQKKAFEVSVESRKMALTNQCFTERTQPSYKCNPNGKPVSAKEFILCRYEQNQQLVEKGGKGQLENDVGGLRAQDAASNRATLETVLNSIFGDAPKNTKPYTGSDEDKRTLSEEATRTMNVFSVKDVDRLYGSQLKGFNGKGIDVYQFVIKGLTSCSSWAKGTSDAERMRAGTPLYMADQSYKDAQKKAHNDANKAMGGYAQKYTEILAGLTGNHFPLDTARCGSLAPAGKVNCMKDIQKNIEGLLLGNNTKSAMTMQIKGANPNSLISFGCQGLNGCITALQNVSTNIEVQKRVLDDAKTKAVASANQVIDNFTNQVANKLKSSAQAVMDRMQQINALLKSTGLGVSGLDIKSIEGKPLEPNEEFDGLYKAPDNPAELLASKGVNILDMQGDSLNQALEGFDEAAKTIGESEAEIGSAVQAADGMKLACAKVKFNRRVRDYAREVDNLDGKLHCFYQPGFCDQKDALQDLSSDMSAVLGDTDEGRDALSVLSGAGDACGRNVSGVKLSNLEGDLKKTERDRDYYCKDDKPENKAKCEKATDRIRVLMADIETERDKAAAANSNYSQTGFQRTMPNVSSRCSTMVDNLKRKGAKLIGEKEALEGSNAGDLK